MCGRSECSRLGGDTPALCVEFALHDQPDVSLQVRGRWLLIGAFCAVRRVVDQAGHHEHPREEDDQWDPESNDAVPCEWAGLEEGAQCAAEEEDSDPYVKYPAHLGKIGASRLSRKVAAAIAIAWTIPVDTVNTKMSQAKSKSSWMDSGERSGRKAAVSKSAAGTSRSTTSSAPMTSWMSASVVNRDDIRRICVDTEADQSHTAASSPSQRRTRYGSWSVGSEEVRDLLGVSARRWDRYEAGEDDESEDPAGRQAADAPGGPLLDSWVEYGIHECFAASEEQIEVVGQDGGVIE